MVKTVLFQAIHFTIIKKYGALHELVCHPCTGAMLIFSVSFQLSIYTADASTIYLCCSKSFCKTYQTKIMLKWDMKKIVGSKYKNPLY